MNIVAIIRQQFSNKLYGWVTLITTVVSIAILSLLTMFVSQLLAPSQYDNKANQYVGLYDAKYRTYYNSSFRFIEKETLLSDNFLDQMLAGVQTISRYSLISKPKRTLVKNSRSKRQVLSVRMVDDKYWHMLSHDFIKGRKFRSNEVKNHLKVAVISEVVAKRMQLDIGQFINVSGGDYEIVGIVAAVKSSEINAYSDVWVSRQQNKLDTNVDGKFYGLIQPKNMNAIASLTGYIRKASERLLPNNSEIQSEISLNLLTFSQVQADQLLSGINNSDVWLKRLIMGLYIILFLVPCINLSSINLAKLEERTSEIALRRALGATKSSIIIRILNETLVYVALSTVIAGLLLSMVLSGLGSNDAFQQYDFSLNPLNLAFIVICVLLFSLMSSIVPAFKSANINIVSALTGGR